MKIGITERGDAGLDCSWYDKLDDSYAGAILITKNANPSFQQIVYQKRETFPNIIVHFTCTGWGGTNMEPGVIKPKQQLERMLNMINNGFPKENCVLRIDPIIPTEEGLRLVKCVLDTALEMGLLPDMRVRVSVVDYYKHIGRRIVNTGLSKYRPCFYKPTLYQLRALMDTLNSYPSITFETCAEPYIPKSVNTIQLGCVSRVDLNLFGVNVPEGMYINPQGRKMCECLSCKSELLDCRHQCAHKCLYCYWKD